MDDDKRAALEAAGFRFSTVAEFLGLSEEENALVEFRVALSQEIRRLREVRKMSQREVARRMKTSQPRIANIEGASPGVSVDLMLRELHVLGGRVARLEFAEISPDRPVAKSVEPTSRNAVGKRAAVKSANWPTKRGCSARLFPRLLQLT